MPSVPKLRIHLLGPLEVIVGDRPISVDTRKALAIVALVAAEGRPFARDELAAMFWPDADDEAARGALRRTLSALRSAVGPVGIAIDRARVSVDPATTWVDLLELERLAASDRDADLEAAAALARGPFLAGFTVRDSPDFDDWQAARAVRVEHIVGDLLDRLAAARSEGGDPSGAIEAARRRVDLDPLDEPGQRRVMDLLARSGDRTGAIRQYRSLVALFDRELGVAPLRETTELYDSIREGRVRGRSAGADPGATGRGRAFPDRDRRRGATHRTRCRIGVDRRCLASVNAIGPRRPPRRRGRDREDPARRIGRRGRRGGGAVVLAARGYPGERAIAYGPIAELLRAGLAAPGGPERLAALDDRARFEIGRLIDLPGELRAVGASAPAPAEATGSRVRLLEAIGQALAALTATDAPGLVWVDDLHLVDDPTREALAYLARRLTGTPVCLLLAWRREDLKADAAASVGDLARLPDVTSVVLDRLDRDDVAAIVRAMRPDALIDDARIDALAADSEGLPLHVVAAIASGDGSGMEMPRSVQALLLERIGSVSETAAQILSAAAIIGRSFELSILRHASGRSEEETIDAVEELMHRGLVREVAGRTGPSIRYDFTHGRIRDVAYASTSLARRRLIHRRAADALRMDPPGPDRDDLARYALIAAHEREAGRTAEAAVAFVEAADRAEAVFANREAIDLLSSALALDAVDGTAAHARIGELRSRLGEYPGRSPLSRRPPRWPIRRTCPRSRSPSDGSIDDGGTWPRRPATSTACSPSRTSTIACAPARSWSAVSWSFAPVSRTSPAGTPRTRWNWRTASTIRDSPGSPRGSSASGRSRAAITPWVAAHSNGAWPSPPTIPTPPLGSPR